MRSSRRARRWWRTVSRAACDRGGHRLRARARQPGGHLNGGVVHVGQVAHRQQPVRHHPEHQDAEHHERRRDGAPDEQSGKTHRIDPPALSDPRPPRISTRAFGVRRSWPSVTTRAPGVTPWAITARLSTVRATVTVCWLAEPSLLTMKTYVPCWLDITA